MMYPYQSVIKAEKHGWTYDGMGPCHVWMIRQCKDGTLRTIGVRTDGSVKYIGSIDTTRRL